MSGEYSCPFCINRYYVRMILAKHILTDHPEQTELMIDTLLEQFEMFFKPKALLHTVGKQE